VFNGQQLRYFTDTEGKAAFKLKELYKIVMGKECPESLDTEDLHGKAVRVLVEHQVRAATGKTYPTVVKVLTAEEDIAY
jgi:hypothetical protein